MSRLTIIVAATKNNGIGKSGTLPWRLRKDMAYFARVTSNAPDDQMNAVVMGRNTWESIPAKFRPLPKRINVVISRKADYKLAQPDSPSSETQLLCSGYDDAYHRLSKTENIHRTFIIGGASLYQESLTGTSLGLVDRILLTRITNPAFDDCDVFMPDFLAETDSKQSDWVVASHEDLEKWVGFEVPAGIQEENGISYEFQMWLREV
ncbi:hypothetical protein SERLA73DRAFT_188721 [Serpula lacrymans var. lacrymans S7.3]|uniref:Dihydrofolate reductase n=2 Tax=Serpula lacrymans var. lacrymans TaxID=341189 RepID=F8QC10_SERL3|nr:uncharacterized protein SERLADRAFT_479123 [Serpula lacrymans var. lacrymans S7.9]EGN94129.1 hypothetical protein SERLA73DRAFT_188721 [Serpula lacrymans var. lacrymans S7.3]EGO19563.1 hypothetical protein SERLADRAFT_479123 [Serpula lacrymans var. lacrymans S7.9]